MLERIPWVVERFPGYLFCLFLTVYFSKVRGCERMIREITKEDAWNVRHRVMWPDKPFDYIKVNGDDHAVHYGLFKDGRLTSVISLFINEEDAQFRKFATCTEDQNKGYGSQLLYFTLEYARSSSVKRVWCNARTNKISYYKKFGLNETDQTFTKGGKHYTIMEIIFD